MQLDCNCILEGSVPALQSVKHYCHCAMVAPPASAMLAQPQVIVVTAGKLGVREAHLTCLAVTEAARQSLLWMAHAADAGHPSPGQPGSTCAANLPQACRHTYNSPNPPVLQTARPKSISSPLVSLQCLG